MKTTFKILAIILLLAIAGVFVKTSFTGFAMGPRPTTPSCTITNLTLHLPKQVPAERRTYAYVTGINGECGTINKTLYYIHHNKTIILCKTTANNCTFISPSYSGMYNIYMKLIGVDNTTKIINNTLKVCWQDGQNISKWGGFCCNTQCSDNICRSSCCAGFNESVSAYPDGCCSGLSVSNGVCKLANGHSCNMDTDCASGNCINNTCQAAENCSKAIIDNGDFSKGLLCWKTLSTGGGKSAIGYSGSSGIGRIYATDNYDGCLGRLYQDVSLTPGVLHFKVKIDKQTLTTSKCNMYYMPAGVYIEYIDKDNVTQSLWQGYYVKGNVKNCSATKLNKSAWTPVSVDLTKVKPTPMKILKIQLFAGGHVFDTKYDNVTICPPNERNSATVVQDINRTITYSLGDKKYTITVLKISQDGAWKGVELKINDATTQYLQEHEVYYLNDKTMIGILKIYTGAQKAVRLYIKSPANICSDNKDNDCDGLTDKEDIDCVEKISKEAASQSITQSEYTTKVYNIGGKVYTVKTTLISGSDKVAKFIINDEATDAMSAGETYTLSDSSIIRVNKVYNNEGKESDMVAFVLGFNFCNNDKDDDNDGLVDLEDKDCQAPAAPTGLHLVSANKAEHSFKISWNNSNVDYYNVYFRPDYRNYYVKVGSTASTSFKDNSPPDTSVTYYYKVSAVKHFTEGSKSKAIHVSFNNNNTNSNNTDTGNNGGNDGGSGGGSGGGGGGGKPQPGPVPTSSGNGSILDSIINFFKHLF